MFTVADADADADDDYFDEREREREKIGNDCTFNMKLKRASAVACLLFNNIFPPAPAPAPAPDKNGPASSSSRRTNSSEFL